jgi:O-antigen ligase
MKPMPGMIQTLTADGLPSSQDRLQGLRGAIAAAILLVMFATLAPFSDLGDPKLLELSSGNETVTYLTLFLLVGCGAAVLGRAGATALRSLAAAPNLLLLAWLLVVSVGLSADPGVSVRRFVLSFTTFLLAAMLPWLTSGLRQFAGLLLGAAALGLLLSYLGLLLVPHLTIHQATDLAEPELAGDWRGIWGHKNAAAGIMAILIYVGWLVARVGRPLSGILVALAAFAFLLGSGGKSALGMVLIVTLLAFLVDRCRPLWAKALVGIGPLALIGFLTVGSIVSETARSFIGALPIDATFTGRTDIWSFAIDALAAHPWKGQGFEAFWYSEAVRFGAEDSTKWMVDVATSHNSYVDLALTVGLPGLGLVLLAFLVMPLRDFHRTLAGGQNVELARFFLLLWLFSLYLGTFEAFFLSRANPLWFFFALAVCGLRYTAQFEAKE